MTDFKPLIDSLEIKIGGLIDKYGMTDDIDSLYEEWVDLKYCYDVDYRGSEDDEDLLEIATDIYNEIVNIEQFHNRPFEYKMENLSLNAPVIAATGANEAVRYKQAIVVKGDKDSLIKVYDKMSETHNVKGKRVNFVKFGGPSGLMYGQGQGKNLFRLGLVDKDLSDKALGTVKKRKRKSDDDDDSAPAKKIKKEKSYTFYIEGSDIILVNADDELYERLKKNGIPYTTMIRDPVVNIRYYNTLNSLGIIGMMVITDPKPETPKPKTPKPKPETPKQKPAPKKINEKIYKVFLYNFERFIVGKHRDIQYLRSIKKHPFTPKKKFNSGGELDLLLINSVDVKPFTDAIGEIPHTWQARIMDESLHPLVWELYPSKKPKPKKKDLPRLEDVLRIGPKPKQAKPKEETSKTKSKLVDFTAHNNIDNWFEFRGNLQWVHPWTRHTGMNNRVVVNSQSNVNQGVIYHIAVKRASNWTKKLHARFKSTASNKVLFTPSFLENLKDAQKRKVPFVAPLVHEFSVKARHANALYINTEKKIIIRYEPHGYKTSSYDSSICDTRLKKAIEFHEHLRGYTYYGPVDFQEGWGPQHNEKYQNKYKKVVKKFGSKERLLEAAGFCMAFTLYFLELALLNINIDPRKVHNNIIGKNSDVSVNQIADRIRIFQSYLVKLSRDFYGSRYKKPFK